MKITVFLFLANILLISSKLRFVFQTYRHGHRSPYPELDKNNRDYYGEHWSNGRAELTEIGMRQHYLLGVHNRILYKDFLNEQYSPSEIYVMSTWTNRTLMSAESQLKGLFPLGAGPKLNHNIFDIAVPPVHDIDLSDTIISLNDNALPSGIQAIPITMITDDYMYLYNKETCSAVKDYYKLGLNKAIIKNAENSFKVKFGSEISKITNIPEDSLNFEKIHNLCDMYVSDYTAKRDLAVFNLTNINKALFNETCFEILYLHTFETKDNYYEVGIYTMTPHYKMVLDYITERVKNDINGIDYIPHVAPKYVMFSAHDSTLSAYQSYLKFAFIDFFKEFIYPSFASSLYFELHSEEGKTILSKDDFWVEVKFNDRLLFNITYNIFNEIITKNNVDMDKLDSFCGMTELNGIEFLFFGVLAIFLAVIVFLYIRNRKLRNGFAKFRHENL